LLIADPCVPPRAQALLPALAEADDAQKLRDACCQRLGVVRARPRRVERADTRRDLHSPLQQAPADVELFELRPVAPGALPPPGARVAVALRCSTLTLPGIESLLDEKQQLQQQCDKLARQLEAARAELQRERCARQQAQARRPRGVLRVAND